MTDDDRAVMDRLAALEAEVKADADAQRARKEAAIAKVRDERAKQQAERDELRTRQAALVTKKKSVVEEYDHADGIGGALELAGKANRVKQELERKPGKGEKSWIKSGIASTALGPIGWLYAGSLREAVPATAAWILLAAIASKILPAFLLMPVLLVALPLSGIAGVVYALQFNRAGKRTRIFGDKKEPKQLKG
ncbi:MAG: hypothetical protein HOV81_04775 [Kofleriaceae bacterium]|nr:hypothetical protein [Kofleriaceae bacterium]